jgi:hypothetical protein
MGIAVSDGKETDFVQMHRNADSALHWREPRGGIASACSSRAERSVSRPNLRK